MKKPLIGSEVLFPNNKLTLKISTLEANNLKIFRLCFLFLNKKRGVGVRLLLQPQLQYGGGVIKG